LRLFADSLWGSGYIASVKLLFEFRDDALLPPFTSKAVKTALMSLGCLEGVSMLYLSRRRYRPVTLRAMRRPGGHPLYVTYSEFARGVRGVRVRRGEVLEAHVTVYTREPLSIPPCTGEVAINGSTARVWVASISSRSLESLVEGDPPRSFRLRIETPLVIPAKLMVPPGVRSRRLEAALRRLPSLPRLLVTPAYLMAQAARQWAAIVQGLEYSESYYYIGRLADAFIVERGFRLRPVKAVYDVREGRVRAVKGVVGWLELMVAEGSIAEAAAKLLAFSSYMGLGRSRSVGFGEVRVEAL
jgi:hypothetical protein